MAAAPPKPWKAEYAKSGRSSCKSCKSPINKDQLRLGKMVTATMFDGFMPLWNHAGCVFKKANQIKAADDVEGLDSLRWEDQQRLRKYVESEPSTVTKTADNVYAIEVSQTARAACKHCSQKIMKGTIRVSSKPEGPGTRGLAWYHGNCFVEVSPSTNLEKITGWDSLSSEEKQSFSADLKIDASANKADASSKGSKRKTIATDGRKSKAPKTDQCNTDGVTSANGRNAESVNSSSVPSNLEKELESQSKALWNIKDELKKHVTTGELKEMLEANGQLSSGSEYDLRDRCADGMLFGPLDSCPLCSSSLHYSGGQYRCSGYMSAWSKCLYSTVEPMRLKEKWKIPDETSNEYLKKWFKSQKQKKPVRILPPLSPNKPLSSQPTVGSQASKEGKLDDIKFSLGGELTESVEDLKNKIVSSGGKFHPKVKKDTSCLVWCGEVNNDDSEIRKSRKMKIPIVRENYLLECIQNQKKLLVDMYRIEPAPETSKAGVLTVKVKGQSAVHEASGLQDCGHILEDGKSIYNTTLNMSDLSTGINSYYILQIIQEDKGSDCYVFRKWGRVGNEKIGGNKLEEMPKSEAIQEFKRLFLEKTGNPWEAWEQKHNFQKQPGRFFPLDIDYGVKNLKKKKDPDSTRSLLAPQLLELMKMLFDVETYRAAMMEFEINLSEMPLGKLSKNNIQKGFEALTEIQNLLLNSNYDPSMKESMIVDASNRFFTLIPSIHPHIIRGEDDFKAKVKMLEALQDIEIASRLVGFDAESDESLDEKYKKLRCDITPLPRDSDDFKLVERYLLNTHAPTHKDWSLQLEDVFALDREGEFDKYAEYRNKLQNKMLLWHGSRLTNFVGILSQGLRIAPPEAPATGYMFGKGVYFADLVSKSAQYCYVDKKSPVGLMLLSEVALGDMHELKKAKYMDKPPKGKHSTKGLGKTVPQESEFVKWRDDVVVPCGKPVSSSIRASELLYNEYIVYDTAQVKMQFLLKVRFNHKR